MDVKITAGGHAFTASLYDNAAARGLWERLPATLPMKNLYGREMCYRMGVEGLPAEQVQDGSYAVGDIVYWPPAKSLVILYKQNGETFQRQPIGHTREDLSFFDGMTDTNVTWEKKE